MRTYTVHVTKSSLLTGASWVGPIGGRISTFRVPDAVQRERSEAVRRCSGTFAKVVCVTIPGLQRTTRLRLALRCARDTAAPSYSRPCGGVIATTFETTVCFAMARSHGNGYP